MRQLPRDVFAPASIPRDRPFLRTRLRLVWAIRRALSLLALALTTTTAQAQAARGPELLLFGGENHKEFLGCLNCGRYSSGSVCNRYGEHGSRYGDKSIWNRFSDYGSKYSDNSPWNKYATNPPVIVDRDGAFYGYFTAARYHGDRTAIKEYRAFLDAVDEVVADLQRASDVFCDR